MRENEKEEKKEWSKNKEREYIYIYIYGWVQVIPGLTLSNVTPANNFL